MKAIIFDLNSTMIDDMDYHTRGWLHIVNNKLGCVYTYDQLKKEMYGRNAEVLKRLFGERYFSAFELDYLSNAKEERYRAEFLPHLKLIDGLLEFLTAAKARQIPMAIASAANTENISFVLDNLNIRHYFSAIVSADDVRESKPHPETFLKAAEMIGVSPPDCLVFEDAPKGAEAAANANMQTIIITTTHEAAEFAHLTNISAYWKNYLTYDERIFDH